MLRRLGQRFERFFRATTPDPFVLAVALTLVVFALAMIVERTSPLEVIRAWQGDSGFWSLLGFTMQMVLLLRTGSALAGNPPGRAMNEGVSRGSRQRGAQRRGASGRFGVPRGGALFQLWGLRGSLVGGRLLCPPQGPV